MSYFAYPLDPFEPDLPLSIFGIGHEDNQPHTIRKNGFPFPQLFFCLSGEGTLKLNEESILIREGTFFSLMPDTPHEYYGNTDIWEINWIAFSGSIALPLLDKLPANQHPIDISHCKNKINSMTRKIFAALKTDDPIGKATASGILYEMIIELYVITHEKNETSHGENSLLKSAEAYIEENYNRDLTLDELAAHVRISPQYLCRLFKKYRKLRPFEYITMKRIQHAKIMLSDRSVPIAEVAHMAGYNSCSYFSLVFRKHEHLSPTEFRGMINPNE